MVRQHEGQPLAVEGTPNGVPININGTITGGNAAASATGAAVPADADYQGLNVAGTLRGQTGVNPTGTQYAADINLASLNGTSLGATVPVSGTITTNEAAPTTVFNGKTTVTTAGTRVVLAGSTTVKSVTIKALAANTGTIYVGNATVANTNGYALAKNETISMDIANLTTVNIDSSVNGEGVTYIAVN